MGAVYNDMTLDGKLTKEQVLAIFNERREQDGYDCGHSYSGSFSQFNGLKFTGREFLTADEAHDYVEGLDTKWGPAICVRHKKYEMPTMASKHIVARRKLEQKIWDAENKLRLAQQKARLNNRSSKPAYVIKAEDNLAKVRATVQPKIDERNAKANESIKKAAAKSTKWCWYLGGLCSS